jgi:hypothetical protein
VLFTPFVGIKIARSTWSAGPLAIVLSWPENRDARPYTWGLGVPTARLIISVERASGRRRRLHPSRVDGPFLPEA